MNHVNKSKRRRNSRNVYKYRTTPYIYNYKPVILSSNYIMIDTIDIIIDSEYDIVHRENDNQDKDIKKEMFREV